MDETQGIAKRMRMQPYARDPNKVARGSDHWQFVTGQAGATHEHFAWEVLHRSHQDHLLPLALAAPSGAPVAAHVDNNRWGAHCECGGFEVVEEGAPFYCFSCHNVVNGGKPRPVVWPSKAQVKAIERALLARPPETRTWYEFETVEGLEAENIAHALPARGG